MATRMKQRVQHTRAQRAQAVKAVEHSLRMEGLALTAQAQADMRLYVMGKMSSGQGLARALARHSQV